MTASVIHAPFSYFEAFKDWGGGGQVDTARLAIDMLIAPAMRYQTFHQPENGLDHRPLLQGDGS